MVVLNQYHRFGCLFDLLEYRSGELAIDLLIVLPVLGPEDGTRMSDVAERPKTFVSKPVVVTLFLFFAQPYPAQRIARIVRWHTQTIVCVYGFGVGISAAVCNPCSVAGF